MSAPAHSGWRVHAIGLVLAGGLAAGLGNWGYEELAAFIYKPKEYVPNTKMLFAGIPAPAEIASLIAYLRAQADSPAPLPN